MNYDYRSYSSQPAIGRSDLVTISGGSVTITREDGRRVDDYTREPADVANQLLRELQWQRQDPHNQGLTLTRVDAATLTQLVAGGLMTREDATRFAQLSVRQIGREQREAPVPNQAEIARMRDLTDHVGFRDRALQVVSGLERRAGAPRRPAPGTTLG